MRRAAEAVTAKGAVEVSVTDIGVLRGSAATRMTRALPAGLTEPKSAQGGFQRGFPDRVAQCDRRAGHAEPL
jgi:hypothetical protein